MTYSLTSLSFKKMNDIILFFVFGLILISPFIKLNFMNNDIIKVIMLVIIVGLTFYDMRIAILATVFFLIISINNSGKQEKHQEAKRSLIPKVIVPEQKEYVAPESSSENITIKENEHMFDLFFDPKIKPFENIISEITGCDNLLSAQNNLVGQL